MQVVDLQRSEDFKTLDIELLSIAPDPVEDWRDAGDQYGVADLGTLLTDEGNQVAERYDVMKWQAATGEPGHTFIYVDEHLRVRWIKDYGAPENGGVMYVSPDEIVRNLRSLV